MTDPASLIAEARKEAQFIAPFQPGLSQTINRLAAALEAATQWRPIETAPRDGAPILIWEPQSPLCGQFGAWHMPLEALLPRETSYPLHDPRIQWYDDRRFAIGYWRPWGGWGNRNSARVNPTHWLPLPQPQETSE